MLICSFKVNRTWNYLILSMLWLLLWFGMRIHFMVECSTIDMHEMGILSLMFIAYRHTYTNTKTLSISPIRRCVQHGNQIGRFLRISSKCTHSIRLPHKKNVTPNCDWLTCWPTLNLFQVFRDKFAKVNDRHVHTERNSSSSSSSKKK